MSTNCQLSKCTGPNINNKNRGNRQELSIGGCRIECIIIIIMCEIWNGQERRAYDQDPGRIDHVDRETAARRVADQSLSKDDTEFLRKHQEYKQRREEASSLIMAETAGGECRRVGDSVSRVSNGRGNDQTGVASNTSAQHHEEEDDRDRDRVVVPCSLTITSPPSAALTEVSSLQF